MAYFLVVEAHREALGAYLVYNSYAARSRAADEKFHMEDNAVVVVVAAAVVVIALDSVGLVYEEEDDVANSEHLSIHVVVEMDLYQLVA